MALLHVRLLGDFQLFYGDQVVAGLNQARQQSLLAYLLLHRDAPQSRQQLAFLFWPDSSETQARANLRQVLHHLHHTLPDAARYLRMEAKTVQWRPTVEFTLDVAAFEHQLAQAAAAEQSQQYVMLRAALAAAIELYRGDLLPACYDDWILPDREAWRGKYLHALEQLILLLEEQRDYATAIVYAQRLLRHDPLHETTYRHLMRLYMLQGERASALRTYHTCVTLLQRELNVDPHPTTQEAYSRLLNLDALPGWGSHPAPRPLAAEHLVGRQAEWAQLQAAWRNVIRGEAHFVLLTGEAGIGKTRLAEELLDWASQQGITTARTRSYAAEGELAYAPVIEWLRSEALQAVLADIAVFWLTEIARLLPELLLQHPTLLRPEPLTERWQRQRLFEALARVFLQAKQPLLLVIDDLQWCDQETLEWLHYLLRFDPKARLLVVGTARSEEAGDKHPLTTLVLHLRSADQLTEIEPHRLDTAETTVLASQVAGQNLDNQASEQLYRQTAGNPLFIVEMVRAGIRAQERETEKSIAILGLQAPIIDLQSLPPKIQAVIQTRLNQLSPTARPLAELAAVIGRAFTFDELSQASDSDEATLVYGLDELWQRRIVREQGIATYDFSHDRIREVTYTLISPMRRRKLHGRVAEALKHLYTNELDAVSIALATHYEQAGRAEQAIHWYQQAATAAVRRSVYSSAVDYLDSALRLLLMLPQTVDRTKQELTILLAKSAHLMPVEGLVGPERVSVYRRMEIIVDQVADARIRFHAKNHLRGFYGLAGYLQKAYEYAEQLLTLASREEELLLHVVACQGSGIVNLQLGYFPLAIQYWSQAETLYINRLSEAERVEHGPIVATMGELALALWLLGYPDQARHKVAAALAQAEVIANHAESSILLFFAELLYRHMGEANLVAATREKITALAAQYAIWMLKLESLSTQGWLLVEQGDFARGIAQMRAEIDELKKIGHTMFQTHRLGLLLEAQLKARQLAAASATLDEAFAMSEQSGQRSWDAELYRLKGDLLCALGDPDTKAELAYAQALQLARQQSAKSLELRAAIGLSRLWQRQGRREEARQLLAEIYTWFTEGFDTVDLQMAKALLDVLSA